MAENEPLHPAVNPDLYVNLDEQREGYAPIESRGWDVLTQNLTGKGRTDPSQTLNQKPVSTPPRQPTCAPLYMANKPGFTHLPICPRK